MVYTCIVKGCGNKPKKWSVVKFHVIPTRNEDMMKRWLFVLDIDPDTPVERVRKMFVCSDHFLPEDYSKRLEDRISGIVETLYLNDTALPSVGIEEGADVVSQKLPTFPCEVGCQTEAPQNGRRTVGTQLGRHTLLHVRSRATQVNLPSSDVSFNVNETSPVNTERPTLQHIIDEEAIIQLLESCPKCNRKCRSTKRSRSPYMIVYQNCYFCEYRRKWASQPEALNINISQCKPRKQKPPRLDRVPLKAETQESHLENTDIATSADSDLPVTNHQ